MATAKTDMETPTQNSKKGLESSGRRFFLAKTETIVKFLALFVLLLPISRFLGFTSPRKVKLVKIDKVLKKDGFIIEPELILFDIDSKPVAVSRTCTHLGCQLNYHELEKMLICPCHKSRFGRDGKRLAGPARLDLPTYKVTTVGTTDVAGYIVAIS